MSHQHRIAAALAVCTILLCGTPLLAQATFTVAKTTLIAADTGAAELTGQIVLTVISGTTVAAPLAIQYSAPITNNSAVEIQVYGTGGLIGIDPNPTIDRLNNAIIINVPAGGTSGSQIRIQGVRVATAGLADTRVLANITGMTPGGNSIQVGQNKVTVIDGIVPPFDVELSSIRLEWRNGTPVSLDTFLRIKETYAADFTSAVGVLGQTKPVLFRVKPFPSVPQGLKLAFLPEAASTETEGKLRAVAGQTLIVPRDDGSTDVLYEFVADPRLSESTIESFQLFINLEEVPPSGSGTVTFQVTMEPLGVAVPNATYPSTDIPRYLPRTLPDEADLITGSTELVFPFRKAAEAVYTGIAITNPLNYRVRATLTAYDTLGLLISGLQITNPVEVILPRSGQIAKLATEVFGPGFNAAGAGTIRVLGNTPALAGFYLQGDEQGPRLDGASAAPAQVHTWVWPVVFKHNPSPFNALELFNPGTATARAELRLYDAAGVLRAGPISQEILAGGTVIRDLSEWFAGIDPGAFAGGYVSGRSDAPLVARETFGNAFDSNVLPGDAGTQKARYYFAHFASGGGYTTEFTLVNLDAAIAADITLTLKDADGNALAIAGNPATFSVPPGRQLAKTLADLFPGLGGSLVTGYAVLDVKPVNVGPFTSVPPLAGAVRFSAADGSSSSALPLFLAPSSDLIYSHVAQSLGYYTGVAILNTSASQVNVEVTVYKADGTAVGLPYSQVLAPGCKVAKLLHELVPESFGQVGGYVRVKSSLPVTSFALFGTDNGLSLSAIPPQNAGN